MAFEGSEPSLGELEFIRWPRVGEAAGPPKLRAPWIQELADQVVCTVLEGQDYLGTGVRCVSWGQRGQWQAESLGCQSIEQLES